MATATVTAKVHDLSRQGIDLSRVRIGTANIEIKRLSSGRAGSCWSKDIKVVQDSENPNEYTVTATVDAGGFSNTPGEYYIEFMITGNEGPFMWNGMFRNIFLD